MAPNMSVMAGLMCEVCDSGILRDKALLDGREGVAFHLLIRCSERPACTGGQRHEAGRSRDGLTNNSAVIIDH